MKKVLTVVLLAAAFCSCKKSTNATVPPNIEPLTQGNYWKYAFATGTDSGTSKKDTFTLKVLSYDSLVPSQGVSYKVLSDSTRKYNFLYRSVGDTDYRRGLFSTITVVAIPDLEEPYYVENSPIGTKWTFPISITVAGVPFPIKATNNYAIVSLTDTMTVNKITYTNVTHIQLNITATGTSSSLGGGDFYYAKGYGALKYTFSVNYSGVKIYQSETLLSSYIK